MGRQDPDELSPRGISRRMALASGGAAMLATALAACGKSSDDNNDGAAASNAGAGNFPKTPEYNFVFVNHVTTNPFFVPTQYGIKDACDLLDCTYQWTGSANADVGQMVNAMNAAIAAKADAIAVPIVDPRAFNEPTEKALQAGIPVFSYNADATDNARLA
jgi:simple sugar transport system substrate-binding protein